jgi:hypothetical protein
MLLGRVTQDSGFKNGEFELRRRMKRRISRVESLDDIFGGANDFLEKSEEHMETQG